MKVMLFTLCALFAGINGMAVTTEEISTTIAGTTEEIPTTLSPEELVTIPIAGQDPCTWGPAHWCSHLKHAAACNATRYCIEREWPNSSVEKDDDSVCVECNNVIQQIRDQSKNSQVDVKTILQNNCKLLIVPSIIDACNVIIDELLPELTETVKSQLDSNLICTTLELCNSPHVDKLLLEHEQS